MKVLDLTCTHGHTFEGWFGSEDDFRDQQSRGLVTCPLCGDGQVVKRPSAPRLNLAHARPPKGEAAPAPATTPVATPSADAALPEPLARLRAAWWRAAREVARTAEDVGPRFAEEARRIHHGDAEERGIRGQATPQEARALLEEGIGVMPLPDGCEETLQ